MVGDCSDRGLQRWGNAGESQRISLDLLAKYIASRLRSAAAGSPKDHVFIPLDVIEVSRAKLGLCQLRKVSKL